MKEHKHPLRDETREPLEEGATIPRGGIPLLLLPDEVLLYVDLPMLLSRDPEDVRPKPRRRATKRIRTRLTELWLIQWEW
jgi:hypothetical protein